MSKVKIKIEGDSSLNLGEELVAIFEADSKTIYELLIIMNRNLQLLNKIKK